MFLIWFLSGYRIQCQKMSDFHELKNACLFFHEIKIRITYFFE